MKSIHPIIFSSLLPYEDFFFIAEAGVNHEGSPEAAITMVEEASRAGAHAIKFQAYRANYLAHKQYATAYWDQNQESATSQHSLFSKFESFNYSDWLRIKEACCHHGIQFWLSIFDIDLAKELSPLCDGLKVASGDLTFARLHDFLISTHKPLIFSTGASTFEEISSLNTKLQNTNSALLFCRLSYPTLDPNAEYGLYRKYELEFNLLKGISDHCLMGNGESVTLAYALGANIVEKHFTLTPSAKGNDHYHSIDPDTLKSTLLSIQRMQNLYHVTSTDVPTAAELDARKGARRSLFFNKDLQKDSIISENDLVELRPGTFCSAHKASLFIGKRLTHDAKYNTPIDNSHIQ